MTDVNVNMPLSTSGERPLIPNSPSTAPQPVHYTCGGDYIAWQKHQRHLRHSTAGGQLPPWQVYMGTEIKDGWPPEMRQSTNLVTGAIDASVLSRMEIWVRVSWARGTDADSGPFASAEGADAFMAAAMGRDGVLGCRKIWKPAD